MALVPRLLSNVSALPSQDASLYFPTKNDDQWRRLSPAGLTAAVEDAVLVAADAVRHLVGKRGNTSPVIEEICGVIVGWAIGVTGRRL